MFKKNITYTNFNGETITKDFYFNLSHAELLEMQVAERGQMEAYLQNIINSGNMRKLMDVLLSFIQGAYGVRSDDGASFLKTDQYWVEFKGSGAWDVLFTEMIKQPEFMMEFIRQIMPEELRQAIDNNPEAAALRTKFDELKAQGYSDVEAASRAQASQSHLPPQTTANTTPPASPYGQPLIP